MSESLMSTTLPSNSIRSEWPRHEISTVFVENSNTKATMEDVYYNNNIILSAQSSAFGATNSFKLTKAYHFLRNAVLKIKITTTTASPGFYNDYVGHSMIDNIKFQVDSTELLQQNGYALVDILNENCENQFQKDKFLELSGYKEIGETPGVYYLYVPLVLPFCGVDAGSFHSAKAFPLYLVPGHIELLIQMRNASDICSVVGNVAISQISLLVNYGKIGNFSQMAKMIRYPTRQYINTQRRIVTAGQNDGKTAITFDITSFRRAELTNLLLRWCPNYVVADPANQKNIFDGADISQLNVLFNGVQIWSNQEMSDPIWDVLSGEEPSYMGFKRQYISIANTADTSTTLESGIQYNYQASDKQFSIGRKINTNSVLTATGNTVNPKNNAITFFGNNSNSTVALGSGVFPKESKWYNLNLSEIRAKMMNNNEYALGYDLSKQTLNISCIFPEVYSLTDNALHAYGGYFYITYVYNSIYQLEEDQSSVLAF